MKTIKRIIIMPSGKVFAFSDDHSSPVANGREVVSALIRGAWESGIDLNGVKINLGTANLVLDYDTSAMIPYYYED